MKMYRGYVLDRYVPFVLIQRDGYVWVYSYVVLPQTKDRHDHIYSVAELGYN